MMKRIAIPSRARSGAARRRCRVAGAARSRTEQSDAKHQERRLAEVHGRHSPAASTRRSTRLCQQLQQARSGLAVQDGQPRSASRDQARGHADQGWQHGLRHGGHPPRGCRAERAPGEQKWMYAMDEGERATRWAPASAVGPRPVLLDRRQGRRSRRLRDHRLPPGLAQRQDRSAGRRLRRERRRRPQAGRRTSARTSRSTWRRGRSASTPPRTSSTT